MLKKIWDMLPEGRPICVPKPEAWGVKQEEEKETDKDLKKKDDVEKEKNLKGLSSLEVKQYLEYMERSRGGKK
jgi:hypothetical protein